MFAHSEDALMVTHSKHIFLGNGNLIGLLWLLCHKLQLYEDLKRIFFALA